ncbi:MAG: alpha/beta hydrolase [Hyphomicrobiales bacterium]|nr:alpha/beta hydrolase [Hyphomicrobiales bacterium]
MSQESIIIDNTRLEVCWVGVKENEKPDLVFLHEGLGCVELWRDFPHALCQKLGMRGLIYSRAGYGKSDPCELPRMVTYMHHEAIEILPKVLDEVDIKSAILIGHSDGGSIAIIHAGATGDSRVKAIVTLAAHVFSEKEVSGVFKSALASYQSGDLMQRLKKYHGKNVDHAFYGWHDAWTLPEFESWNLEEFLPAINVPALIIQGINDEYGTSSQVDAIVKGLGSKAISHLIPDCGHSPHLQQKSMTTNIVCEFIERLEQ